MKRPLFIMLTGLVLGEAVTWLYGEKGIYMMALFMLTAMGWYFYHRQKQGHFRDRKFGFALMAGFAFFGGICFLADASLAECREEKCLLAGRVVSIREKTQGKLQMVLDQVSRCRDLEETGHASSSQEQLLEKGDRYTGKIQVFYTPSSKIRILPGDRVQIFGEIVPLAGPTNKGEFDSRIWYRSQGIRSLFFGQSLEITNRPAFSIRAVAWRMKERIGNIYRQILSPEDAALLTAMALGDKTALSEEQRQTFSENGLAHLLAVSGLHVSILGGCLYKLLKKRGAGYLISCLAGSGVLIFYAFMTGFSSSAARAVIMYLVYLLSQYLGADYDIICAMSLSGILLLTEYPMRLMEGGFQISYLSIFIIGGILPGVQDLIHKRNHGDDDLKAVRPDNRKSFGINIRQVLLSGLIIGCMTAPFLMRLFYEWSPLSLVLNLILLPCMEPLMISAVCGGLAGLLVMDVARLCLLPAQGILMLFHTTFDMTDRLPVRIWITGCPAIWQLLIIYALMIIIFFLLLYPDLIRLVSILFALLMLTVYEQTGSVSLLSQTRESGLKIDMLDVGQGECNLIRTADRKTVIIDGGSSSRDNIGRDVIIPALKYYGVKRIDYLVATHMDSDHISGLTELFVRGFPVRHVLIPAAGRNDPAWTSFYKLALKSGCHVSLISRGDRISFGRMTLSCLHPQSGYEPEDRNDSSVVLALAWRQFDMLFTGDLGPEGEKDLISYLEGISGNSRPSMGKQSKSSHRKLDVLKVAHHGSGYSTSREFLTKYPGIRAALISAGRNNHYGHPHQALLKRLKKRKIKPFITKEIGAIHLVTDGESFSIKGYLDDGS